MKRRFAIIDTETNLFYSVSKEFDSEWPGLTFSSVETPKQMIKRHPFNPKAKVVEIKIQKKWRQKLIFLF